MTEAEKPYELLVKQELLIITTSPFYNKRQERKGMFANLQNLKF